PLKGQLSLVSLDGGDTHVLYEPEPGGLHVPDGFMIPGLAWTKDGRSLYFAKGSPGGWELMRIAAAGGTPESTGLTGRRMQFMDLSPDGSRIVYGDGGSADSYEVLVVDDIVAAFNARR